MTQNTKPALIDDIDRRIITATQEGLPLVPRPYDKVAQTLGLPAVVVKERFKLMLDRGIIRRIGAIPNHYRLGITANGMSVWEVDEALVDELGEKVGALDYVTHSYRRPKHPPQWPYNLFAMVHGRTRQEVEEKVGAIRTILQGACRTYDILYSTKILKKTGLRLSDKKGKPCSV